jgi:hypothetical protein
MNRRLAWILIGYHTTSAILTLHIGLTCYPSISLPTTIFFPAGPFPRPEMSCTGGLRFSPGAPLPGGTGLGSLISTPLRYLGSGG